MGVSSYTEVYIGVWSYSALLTAGAMVFFTQPSLRFTSMEGSFLQDVKAGNYKNMWSPQSSYVERVKNKFSTPLIIFIPDLSPCICLQFLSPWFSTQPSPPSCSPSTSPSSPCPSSSPPGSSFSSPLATTQSSAHWRPSLQSNGYFGQESHQTRKWPVRQ